jgi:hypothetical protein
MCLKILESNLDIIPESAKKVVCETFFILKKL